jgi:hypothetical protein
MTRFLNHQIENLALLWALATEYAPKIAGTARDLSQYVDFENNPWGAVRASAAYWLWVDSDLFSGRDVPVRISLGRYMESGDTASCDPLL